MSGSNFKKLIISSFLVLWALSFVYGAKPNMFTRRILRITGNIASKTNRPEMLKLVDRGKKSGYNVIAWDSSIWDLVHANPSAAVTDGIKEVKNRCDASGLHFIPMSLGQLTPSRIDLYHAEAFPVKNTKFVVSGGEAKAQADTALGFINAGFEDHNGKAPSKWGLLKLVPGKDFFMDTVNKRPGSTGKVSIRIENPQNKGMKLRQNLALKPWRAYRLTAWIKTENMSKSRDVGFEVNAGIRTLLNNRYSRGVHANTNWKLYEFDFNSLETKFAQVYLCITNHFVSTGKVWFDDVAIEEVGLYECVRRPTLPIVVKGEDGTVYRQGKDYTITTSAKVSAHDQGRLLIPAGSSIKNGQTLRVDWYQMANMRTHTPGASYCHQGAWDLVKNNAKASAGLVGGPKGWFLKIHSEWSLAYWDPACQSTYPTAGAYMGGVVTNHIKKLHEATGNPYIEPYIWSDMVDAHHHGEADNYFYVNGSPRASWMTLDPQTVIVNWNEGHKYESMKFFAGMNPKYKNVFFRNICSFWAGSGPSGWLTGLDRLEKEGMKAGSVVGMMYTTWGKERDGGFAKIESFASAAQGAGRWGTGPYNPQPAGVKPSAPKHQNVPFGFSIKGTRIGYHLSQNGKVRVDLINGAGQLIRVLADGEHKSGTHEMNVQKESIASGVYFVRLQIGEGFEAKRIIRKMVLF